MKTQLLQDIGESQPTAPPPRAGEGRIPDAPQPDAPPVREQRIEPELRASPRDPEFMSSDIPLFSSAPGEGFPKRPPGKAGWFERWGRRFATWGAGLVMLLLLAGAGLWLYKQTKVEMAMAVLAKAPIPEQQIRPARAMPAPAPAPVPQLAPTTAPSAAAMPPPEALSQQPAEPSEGSMQAADSPSDIAASIGEEEVLVQPSPPAPKKVKRKRASKAATSATVQESSRDRQRAETLRQCRIAGYHASQCLQRGCMVTKYGLACKGK